MRKYLTVLATLSLVFTQACKTSDGNNNSGVSTQKYNDLVRLYNSSTKTSADIQNNSRNSIVALLNLDREIMILNASIEASTNNCTVGNLADSKNSYSDVIEKINKVETSLSEELIGLKSGTNTFVYKELQAEAIAALEENFKNRGESLAGIKNLVRIAFTQSLSSIALRGGAECLEVVQSLSANQILNKKVELTKDEKIVSQVSSKGGIFRNSQGNLGTLRSSQEVEVQANQMGLDVMAAKDAYVMSQSTGGIIGLASSSDDLSRVVQDLFGHIKNNLNSNSDDLELVFTIDYSASMGDDIQSVISNLSDITNSLIAVQKSGRNVKIGITTFGIRGRETINLDLTSDLVRVAGKLQNLLNDYDNNQHSTNPGEASYSGLLQAANKISWSSKNRKIIVITDEPSWEVQTNRTDIVNAALKAIKSNNVQTSIYTIVVGSY